MENALKHLFEERSAEVAVGLCHSKCLCNDPNVTRAVDVLQMFTDHNATRAVDCYKWHGYQTNEECAAQMRLSYTKEGCMKRVHQTHVPHDVPPLARHAPPFVETKSFGCFCFHVPQGKCRSCMDVLLLGCGRLLLLLIDTSVLLGLQKYGTQVGMENRRKFLWVCVVSF